MSTTTSIEWSHKSWNPTSGCDHVSPGCANCYADTMAKRCQAMGNQDYRNGFAFTLQPHRLEDPKRWRKPQRIFVNSMSDLFHREMPAEYLGQVLQTVCACPQHTFQVLTKRPERMAYLLGPKGCGFYATEAPVPNPQPNLWLGVSVESQRFITRIHTLAKVPAAVRFISFEPLLEDLCVGPLALHESDLQGIHWAIVGGESGHHARPCNPEWIWRIKQVCEAAGVAVFVKQMGSVWARESRRFLKAFTGECEDWSSKGANPEHWNEALRHREFPPRYWVKTNASAARLYTREQYIELARRVRPLNPYSQDSVGPFHGYGPASDLLYTGHVERVFQ